MDGGAKRGRKNTPTSEVSNSSGENEQAGKRDRVLTQSQQRARNQAIVQRNIQINNAAAADASHDFKALRGKNTDKITEKIKQLMQGIGLQGAFNGSNLIKELKGIGTFMNPDTAAIDDEWETFKKITGLSRESVQSVTPDTPLTILEDIVYTWSSYPIGEKDAAGNYVWSEKGVGLFDKIAGRPDETGLYFLIDAVSVTFYAALAADQGATSKFAFFVNSRESLNDSANKPWAALKSFTVTARTVKIEVINDEFDVSILYPPMKDNSTDFKYLFNSTMTVDLQALGKTREGIHSVKTTFLDPGRPDHSITSVKGGIDDAHPNSVNTLIVQLAAAYKAYKGAAEGPKREEAKSLIYKLLQQKRGGDWLQVLSCLDTTRFKEIPVGSMVFFCTEDIIAAAYGIAVGANVMYTYVKDKKYCIAVFRRNLKPPTPKELLESFKKMVQSALYATDNTKMKEMAEAHAIVRTRVNTSTMSLIRDSIEQCKNTVDAYVVTNDRKWQQGVNDVVGPSIGFILQALTNVIRLDEILPAIPSILETNSLLHNFMIQSNPEILKNTERMLTIQQALLNSKCITDTVDYILSVKISPKPANDTQYVEAYVEKGLNAQNLYELRTQPYVLFTPGHLSYMLILLPVFERLSAGYKPVLEKFLTQLSRLYDKLYTQHKDSQDVKRFKDCINSLHVLLGDNQDEPIDLGPLMEGILYSEDSDDDYMGILFGRGDEQDGGGGTIVSSKPGLFFALHRVIAWGKLHSIKIKEGVQHGGRMAPPSQTMKLSKKSSVRKTPKKTAPRKKHFSHPIITVWFFYRELLYRLETAVETAPYELILQVLENSIQQDVSWIALESLILGGFPRWSDHMSSLTAGGAVDVEQISSTFANGFLGKPYFEECYEMHLKHPVELKTMNTYSHDDFYKTYKTMLPKFFAANARHVPSSTRKTVQRVSTTKSRKIRNSRSKVGNTATGTATGAATATATATARGAEVAAY